MRNLLWVSFCSLPAVFKPSTARFFSLAHKVIARAGHHPTKSNSLCHFDGTFQPNLSTRKSLPFNEGRCPCKFALLDWAFDQLRGEDGFLGGYGRGGYGGGVWGAGMGGGGMGRGSLLGVLHRKLTWPLSKAIRTGSVFSLGC